MLVRLVAASTCYDAVYAATPFFREKFVLSYRTSWWLLAGGCVVSALLILLVVPTEPPVAEPAVTDRADGYADPLR